MKNDTISYSDSYIHPTAIIYDNVKIGTQCYIGPYCVIGAPPEWKGREHKGKGVVIGNNVRITGLVTIDAGADDSTIIEDNCYIMKGVHIGHDAIIMEGVTLSPKVIIGGHSVVMYHTNMGMGSIVHQKVLVPSHCMIGMGTIITKKSELKHNSKYVGNPARYLSENKKS